MTISSETRKVGPFEGNDVTVAFPFTFKVFTPTDVLVVKADSAAVETELTLDSHYSVSLNADQDASPGGTVTLTTALATGETLIVSSQVAPMQSTDLTNMGGFYPSVINSALDKLTILIQQLTESMARSLKFSITTPADEITELPSSGRAGKAIGFAADGSLAVIELSTGTTLANIAASSGSSLVGFIQAGSGAELQTVQTKLRERVSVLDFGADPTGVTDSTAAFNFATGAALAGTGFDSGTGIATDTWPKVVEVPPGQYKLTGTVYVHKGQHLRGDGQGGSRILCTTMSAYAGPVFKLGYSTLGEDSGGLPPEISGLWTYGGPQTYPIVLCDISGYSVHDLFISACGDGISMLGTDGRVENIQIDQAYGTGIKIGGHNHIVSNVSQFLPYYGFYTANSSSSLTCSDINIDNCQVFYPRYNGIRFDAGVAHANIRVSDCIFTLNAQHATFRGFVESRCNYAEDLIFTDCSFNNMNGPAYLHETGIDNTVYFNGCTFNGTKTVSTYAQSTTAYAVNTKGEEVYLNNCHFKNLLAEPIRVDGSSAVTRVFVNGGAYYGCTANNLFSIGATPPVGGHLMAMGVLFHDMDQQAFPAAGANKWYLSTDHAQVLAGNGATTITQYPFGHGSVFMVNTASAAAKVSMPRKDDAASVKAKHGDTLTFVDYNKTWDTNNVTFLAGDNSINGAAVGTDYVANVKNSRLTFTYNAVTDNWHVN